MSIQTIVTLIASAKTRKGVVAKADIDTNQDAINIKFCDQELGQVKRKRLGSTEAGIAPSTRRTKL